MIAIFLAAAATVAQPVISGPTAIDAERAFARDAQRIGQWAAFRKYAARDAVMFTPQVVWARDFLKDRKEPRRTISWSPAASVMSCDGTVAVNAGPYSVPGATGAGSHGRFTTVWLKGSKGWRWIYDGGEPTAKPVPAGPVPLVSRAACTGHPTGAPIASAPTLSSPATAALPNDYGRGESADRTLGWDWKVEKSGMRTLRVYQWTGRRYAQRVYQRVAP
ncbi:hypothetical protein [Sphingomonas sp.]|uniref:hypothetical protein n=1 Tax=Sphingomonas sp. TaxID=28214 RepID=UPI00325FC7FA